MTTDNEHAHELTPEEAALKAAEEAARRAEEAARRVLANLQSVAGAKLPPLCDVFETQAAELTRLKEDFLTATRHCEGLKSYDVARYMNTLAKACLQCAELLREDQARIASATVQKGGKIRLGH